MKKILKALILSFILMLPCSVFASNVKSSLILNNKDLYKGDTLKVTIGLEQDTTNNEFNIFETVIEFDENTFYGIDEESFETSNGWGDVIYNSETHALVVIHRYGTVLDEDVISFELKVKDTANPAVQSVGLKNSYVSNPNGDVDVEYNAKDVNVNMSLVDINNSVSTEKYFGKTLNNVPVKLYYILTLIVLELIIAIILVLIYYTASNKLTVKAHRRILMLILCVVEASCISAIFTYNFRKGDLNGDSEYTYDDSIVLAEHIVNKNMLSKFKLENADMNNDGAITPADLAIIVQSTTKKTTFVATLSDAIMEANAYEKGSMVDVRFLANVTNDETIKYVMVDGEKHKVERLSNKSNEYIFKLEASNESKRYNYNVTEVFLENGKSAQVDYDTELVVLKDSPVLSAFTTKEDVANSQVHVALTITDVDGAIVNSYYELYKANGEKVSTGQLVNGKNAFSVNLENAVSYKLKLRIDYNRGADSGEYYGTIEDEYDLKIITDYRLTMSNISFVQNGKETSDLEKNTETFLMFKSSNVSGYNPKKINIDGREYSVSNLGYGKFKVVIPNSRFTSDSMRIKKVTLSNGKVILVNHKVAYTILKDKPTVATITKFEDIVNSKMDVALSLNDVDNTVSRVIVKLFDKNDELISEKEALDNNLNFELPTRDTSEYILRVYADYSRLDNSLRHVYKEELLYEENIAAIIKAYVHEYKPEILYPDKNSVIKLIYNVTSNYNENVKSVIIDNVIYDVRKTALDTYEVEVPVGENSGIKEYVTRKIIFANGMSYDIEESLKIDVLKEEPIIENYTVVEDLKNSKITLDFDVYDKDSAYTSGKVVLKDKNTSFVIDEKIMILGKNQVEFALENAVKYDIEFLINANLDTKVLEENSTNKLENYVTLTREYMLVTDYKLELTSIDSYNEEGLLTDYFKRGERIELKFTSTNLTEYYPIKAKIDGVVYDLVQSDGTYTLSIDGKDNSGVSNLKFESIILSNHAEIVLNCTKKIEILKETPKVSKYNVEVVDNKINLTLDILDEETVMSNSKVIITDENDTVIYENLLTDEVIEFDMTEGSVYKIDVIGTYDLDTNTFDTESNSYVDVVVDSKVIDFSKDVLDINNITLNELYKKIDDEQSELITTLSVDDLESLENFLFKITLNDGQVVTYNIVAYEIIDDKLSLILDNDLWILYDENKYRSDFNFEYGKVEDGMIYPINQLN